MRSLLVSTLLAVSLVPASVLADEAQASAPDASAQPAAPARQRAADEGSNWSIGAGSSVYILGNSDFYSYSAYGDFGYVSDGTEITPSAPPALRRAYQPSLSLFAERRLGATNWLLAQVQFFHDTAVDDLKPNLESAQTTAELDLGVRHVFNPEGVIQVSGFVLAGFGYSRLFQRGEQTFRPGGVSDLVVRTADYENSAWSIGASAGVAFERRLLDQFALRFSSSLVRASYFKASTSLKPQNAAAREQKSHGLDLGLWFTPSIELRYFF
jgi:hypothetical protein